MSELTVETIQHIPVELVPYVKRGLEAELVVAQAEVKRVKALMNALPLGSRMSEATKKVMSAKMKKQWEESRAAGITGRIGTKRGIAKRKAAKKKARSR